MRAKKSSWFSLISGLLSLMLCWFFWVPVYGIIFTLITTLLAVMALITGRNLKKQYKQSPESLDVKSLRNARYGVVLGVIGILVSLICFIFAILFYFVFKFLN